MNRRRLLRILAALPFAGGLFRSSAAAAATAPLEGESRPGESGPACLSIGVAAGVAPRPRSARAPRRCPCRRGSTLGGGTALNKGLAGRRSEAIEAARDTAMNPAVVDAFALAICGAGGPPAYFSVVPLGHYRIISRLVPNLA
jgi:hypothetical protein